MNRMQGMRKFSSVTRNLSVESWYSWFKQDALDMNPSYQRDYVWTQKEQNEFLNTLLSGFPIGVIAISDNSRTKGFMETKWIEVIDGKQRLTTLGLVFSNKIPLPLSDGSNVFWDDLTPPESRKFRSIPMSCIDLSDSTEKERIEFFYRVNFTGVPQSEEHRNSVIKMLEKL
ncbi:hypothetical protein POP12_100 [Pectobacterium phage POP12]|nr:hypothetical protein POP12_100 [Pectobacterium phage POP12]